MRTKSNTLILLLVVYELPVYCQLKLGGSQVAAIFRRIQYLNQTKMEVLYLWGILLSTNIELNEKDILFGQYSVGQDIANYNDGFVCRQLDTVYVPGLKKMTLILLNSSAFPVQFRKRIG